MMSDKSNQKYKHFSLRNNKLNMFLNDFKTKKLFCIFIHKKIGI